MKRIYLLSHHAVLFIMLVIGQAAWAQLPAQIKWSWTSSNTLPTSINVITTPIIADLDRNGIPDIVVPTYSGASGADCQAANLRAFRGTDGAELFTIVSNQVMSSAAPAVGDIDGDGFPEIITVIAPPGNRLIAFEHDGVFKWLSPQLEPLCGSSPSIADLNGDRVPEVVVARHAVTASGQLLWSGTAGRGGSYSNAFFSHVADINGDGLPDLLAGNTLYSNMGAPLWQASLPDGYTALANFDPDPFPEIVLVVSDKIYLLEHDGSPKWGPVLLPGSGQLNVNGGPPLVADLDGNGVPEIAVSAGRWLAVFSADGMLRWSSPIDDYASLPVTGVSAFDFDADGRFELLHRDLGSFRIFDGTSGAVLFAVSLSTGTAWEYPAVVDVDGDDEADIVTGVNPHGMTPGQGLYVFESSGSPWADARDIWNQHTYHVTNVNADATIPQFEINSWWTHNSVRAQCVGASCDPSPCSANPTVIDFEGLGLSEHQNPGEIGIATFNGAAAVAGSPRLAFFSIHGDDLGGSFPFNNSGNVFLTNVGGGGSPETVKTVTVDFSQPVAQLSMLICDIDSAPPTNIEQFQAEVFDEAMNPLGIAVHTAPTQQAGGDGIVTAISLGQIDGIHRLVITLREVGTNQANTALGFGIDAIQFSTPSACTVQSVDPAPGTDLPIGSEVTLSGRIGGACVGTAAILIDGVPAQSLDHWGQFFHPVSIAEIGTNCFAIAATLINGIQCETTVCLQGVNPNAPNFEETSNVTRDIAARYSNTTYNVHTRTFVTFVAAINNGLGAIDAPILLVIDSITDSRVRLINADGITEDGRPYVMVVDPVVQPSLAPGQQSAARVLAFDNPEGVPVRFQISWRALTNRAPVFQSVPSTIVSGGALYSYSPVLHDPDAHDMTLIAEVKPAGASLAQGTLQWTPTDEDLGAHSVSLLADDGHGGQTRQNFIIEVLPLSMNRPPLFASAPVTHVAAAADYVYDVLGIDPDGDTVSLSLLTGPPGMQFIASPQNRLEWQYALPDPIACPNSDCTISVQASDERGGLGVQTFVLTVGNTPSNPNAPSLFGTPATEAAIGALYLYQPTGGDPDPTDVVEYDLPTAPMGMQINAATGRVTWTPTSGQDGPHQVRLRVRDRAGVAGPYRGGSTTQDWTITVSADPVNRSPVILSVPPLTAKVNLPYSYQLEIADPEGQSCYPQLVDRPPGMSVNPAGLVSWIPDSPGPYVVAIRASDPQGKAAHQVYLITVYPPNLPPTFNSTPPPGNILTGTTYLYDANAQDLDGDILTYALQADQPPDMLIDPRTGLISWSPTSAQVGPHSFHVDVFDSFGGSATQLVNVMVVADAIPPNAVIIFSNEPGHIDEPMIVCLQAGDNVGVATRVLSADTTPLTLDSSGCVSYTPTSVGTVTFDASVTDPSGNPNTTNRDLLVIDPHADQPQITLIAPSLPATITAPMPIQVTITDPLVSEFSEVRVTIRPFDTQQEEVLADLSDVPVMPMPTEIAVIDPTKRPNGDYYVAITAVGANAGGIEFPVSIAGDFKLGNFTMSFTDLAIPLAGIPIVITRTYDSLNTRKSDFGSGWRLDLPGSLTDGPMDSPTGSEFGNEAFKPGSRVHVTKPDGRRIGFTFIPRGIGSFFGFLFYPEFTADAGVTDKLQALNAPTYLWFVGGEFLDFFVPFNPRLYRLTTKEGLKYDIDEFNGLNRIEDVNGNTIDVAPGGLISTTGVAITFVRDGLGRITDILEPDPQAPGQLRLALAKQIAAENETRERKSRRPVSRAGRSLPTDNPTTNRPHRRHSPTETAQGTNPCAGMLHYEYDSAGNLESFTDQECNTTNYFYENAQHPNYLTRILDPLNRPMVRSVFDNDGRLAAVCDANGNPSPPYVGCTVFDHDVIPGGTTTTITNARGCPSILEFDANGNVVHELRWLDDNLDDDFDCTTGPNSGRWLETTRVYDASNNLLSETSPPTPEAPQGYTWSFTYDSRGNQLTKEDPGGRTWVYAYNDCNKVTSETDAMGNVTTYQYDEFCNLRFVTDALGGVTEYRYENPFRQRSHFIDAVGNTWQFFCDANGYPSGFTDPLGNSAMTQFNEVGELEFSIDRRGWRIEFDYDDAHRVKEERWIDPTDGVSVLRTIAYSYNNAGQILTAIDPDSSLAMDYYPTGLLQYVDNVGTPGAPQVRIDYSYDANGNVIRVADTLGGFTDYMYDSLDRNARIVQFGTGVNEKRVDMEYDDASALRVLRRFADLAGTQGVANTFYEYDCGVCPSRLSSIHHRKASDNSIIHDLDYVRDSLGNILEITDAEGFHRCTYDGLRRLLTTDHPAGGLQPDEFYTYDAVDNRLTSHLSALQRYSYQLSLGHGGNQLREDDHFEYTYDLNGNLCRQMNRSTDIHTDIVYNHRNRPISIVRYDEAGAELERYYYTYDAAFRRSGITHNSDVFHAVYDGPNTILKLDASGGLVLRRSFDRTQDGILAEDIMGNTRFVLTDHVGSVRMTIGVDSKSVTTYTYDTFGRVILESGVANADALLFNGREFDMTGEYGNYRSRLYSPSIGRFVQEDPRFPLRYDYANNNPLVFIDASGESILDRINLFIISSRTAQVYACVTLSVASIAARFGCFGYCLELVPMGSPLGRVAGTLCRLSGLQQF